MKKRLNKQLGTWLITLSISASLSASISSPSFALSENNYESIFAKAEHIKKSSADESLELAQAVAHQSQSPQLRAKALNLSGVILKRKKRYTEALNILNESYKISKEIGITKMAVESLNNIADTQRQSKNNNEAISTINTAIKLAIDETDGSQLVTLYRTQGKIYKAVKQYKKSLTSFLEAEKFVDANTSYKTAADVFNKIAQAYARLEHLDKAAEYKAKVLQSETKDPSIAPITLARNFDDLSTYSRKLGDYRKALQYGIRALKTLDGLDEPETLQHTYLNLTIIFRRLGEYNLALGYAKKLRQSYLAHQNPIGVGTSNIQMALIYDNLKQYQEANKFYQETLDLPKEQTTQKNRASASRGIASIHHKQGNFKEALQFAEQAKSIYTKINSLSGIESSLRLIGVINTSLGNTDKALNAFTQALTLSRKLNSKWEEASNLINIGVALADSKPSAAVKNIEQGIKISTKVSAKLLTLRGYRALARISENNGSYERAYKYSDMLRQLSNEINHDLITKRISDLEIVSESDNKERKIERLQQEAQTNDIEIAAQAAKLEDLGAQNLLLKSNLSREQNTLTLIVLFIVICFTFCLVLFSRIRRIQKSNTLSNTLMEQPKANIEPYHFSGYQASTIIKYLRESFSSIVTLSKALHKRSPQISTTPKSQLIDKCVASAEENLSQIDFHANYFLPLTHNSAPKLELHSFLELYTEVYATFVNEAKAKNILLETNIANNLFVKTDKNIAKAIIFHLLTNIIRISQHDSTIFLSTQDNSNSISLNSITNGYESSTDNIAALFSADKKAHTNEKLAEVSKVFNLCTELAKLVAGDIGARSVESEATQVYLTLPTQ